MSTPKNDGGPAFPGPSDYNQDGTPVWGGATGMTLRDWFAGQALVGMMANPEVIVSEEDVARIVYRYADAVLEERRAKKGGGR